MAISRLFYQCPVNILLAPSTEQQLFHHHNNLQYVIQTSTPTPQHHSLIITTFTFLSHHHHQEYPLEYFHFITTGHHSSHPLATTYKHSGTLPSPFYSYHRHHPFPSVTNHHHLYFTCPPSLTPSLLSPPPLTRSLPHYVSDLTCKECCPED